MKSVPDPSRCRNHMIKVPEGGGEGKQTLRPRFTTTFARVFMVILSSPEPAPDPAAHPVSEPQATAKPAGALNKTPAPPENKPIPPAPTNRIPPLLRGNRE